MLSHCPPVCFALLSHGSHFLLAVLAPLPIRGLLKTPEEIAGRISGSHFYSSLHSGSLAPQVAEILAELISDLSLQPSEASTRPILRCCTQQMLWGWWGQSGTPLGALTFYLVSSALMSFTLGWLKPSNGAFDLCVFCRLCNCLQRKGWVLTS